MTCQNCVDCKNSIKIENLLRQAALNGVLECPECGLLIEPDCPGCGCGWENPLPKEGFI